MSSRERAWLALTEALKATLPPQTVEAFVGGTHTAALADNLLPGLSETQVALVQAQLREGDGGELTPTATGKRKACAPYSSSALAANAFVRWLDTPEELRLADHSGFDRLRLEERLRIAHGGGTANLDIGAYGPGVVMGVESKLTETLEPHPPVRWRRPYLAPAMRDLLAGGWAEVFDRSVSGEWTPRHVGLEQLLKHALALNSHVGSREAHLLYLYWEPVNGGDIPEVVAHRSEVARLRQSAGGGTPQLHTLTYGELFDEWDVQGRGTWLAGHVHQLRERYEIEI